MDSYNSTPSPFHFTAVMLFVYLIILVPMILPRASLAVVNAAKALAAIRGRDFVTPDDIVWVAPAVLRHRIMLTPDKEMEGVSPDDIIKQIIQKIEVPR